jgi:predicted alpha/beta-hydrolase family hydrolase
MNKVDLPFHEAIRSGDSSVRPNRGSREEVVVYKLSPAVQVAWMKDGDHSYKPRRSSGRTEQQNQEAALGEIATFLKSCVS